MQALEAGILVSRSCKPDLRYNWCQEWDAKMSTRAYTKQQELEEQLARLLSMMELQQQRQEQLAREQQQRQGEQQQQRELLIKQQRKAEEQMGILKDDLQQTKDGKEGPFQATEESLEGMH